MALLTPQSFTIAGATPTYAAATALGDTVRPSDYGYLHVKNTNGASRTVTIVDPRTTDVGGAHPDVAVVVAATTGDKIIGPLAGHLANGTTGLIDITYSADAGVTVAYLTFD